MKEETKTIQQLQDVINENGFKHVTVLDKDHLSCIVDGEPTVFSRSDRYGGHPLSGFASYGSVSGDWRMIEAICNDMQYCFDLL